MRRSRRTVLETGIRVSLADMVQITRSSHLSESRVYYTDMVYPVTTDRPRGILTEADREYLMSDKSGYTHQQQSNAKRRITERIVNALLDFKILENHLDEEIRDDVFDLFDMIDVSDEDITYGKREDYLMALTDLLAFIYRETREGTEHHPTFAQQLETAVVQGEFEPGTTYYGPHNIDIEVTFEKVHPEAINIQAIAERIEEDGIDSLTEAEMREFLKVLSRSKHLDTDKIQKEFNEWVDEFEEEHPISPNSIGEILAHVEGKDPGLVRMGLKPDDSSGEDETDQDS